MGWTKQELIQQAFAEIGLGHTFNVGPEQLQGAAARLDAMMGVWSSKGVRLGYVMSSSLEGTDLDVQSGIPDVAYEAVVTNLAVRLAPGKGKTLSQETRTIAHDSYKALLARAAFPPEQQLPNTLPRGAGNKPGRSGQPFMPTPVDPLVAAEGGDQIEFD